MRNTVSSLPAVEFGFPGAGMRDGEFFVMRCPTPHDWGVKLSTDRSIGLDEHTFEGR